MNDDKLAEIRERHERADADARITWIRIGMDAHDDRAALLAEADRYVDGFDDGRRQAREDLRRGDI